MRNWQIWQMHFCDTKYTKYFFILHDTRGSASQISANHYPTTWHCQKKKKKKINFLTFFITNLGYNLARGGVNEGSY
jgi:hypothetical protein